jgi:hypothetical protein
MDLDRSIVAVEAISLLLVDGDKWCLDAAIRAPVLLLALAIRPGLGPR